MYLARRGVELPSPEEIAFTDAMLEVYHEAKRRYGYNAVRFLQMVSEQGGVQTALNLIGTADPSDGFRALYELGKQDGLALTVEALVQDPQWHSLIPQEYRDKAVRKLKRHGIDIASLTGARR